MSESYPDGNAFAEAEYVRVRASRDEWREAAGAEAHLADRFKAERDSLSSEADRMMELLERHLLQGPWGLPYERWKEEAIQALEDYRRLASRP